jgi:isochorismate pyruvate lyase
MAKKKPKSKAKAKPASKASTKVRKAAKAAKASGKKSKGGKAKPKLAKEPAWRRTKITSLADVRANIDRLDAAIVPLLCERLYFVTQAANFKPSVAGVVVPARVEQIIASVRALAEKLGARPETMESVYRNLIDAFTADEQRHWAELNTQKRLSDKW